MSRIGTWAMSVQLSRNVWDLQMSNSNTGGLWRTLDYFKTLWSLVMVSHFYFPEKLTKSDFSTWYSTGLLEGAVKLHLHAMFQLALPSSVNSPQDGPRSSTVHLMVLFRR